MLSSISHHTFKCTRVQSTVKRFGHSVRIILLEDLPPRGYAKDTITVKAGYARNKLIPHKIALYATPQNFERVGIVDPLLLEAEKKEAESLSDQETADKYAAFVLDKYLKNKVLKMWRNASEDGAIHPGMVDVKAIREKLSKQLKIDLEDHEKITLDPTPVDFYSLESELKNSGDDDEMVSTFDSLDDIPDCSVQLKRLGEYMATIYLRGGFKIPLKLKVVKR